MELQQLDKETVQILVVDDERSLRESCASILSEQGYKVASAGRGDEALDMIRRLNPDIILLDLFLPNMSGVDILKEAMRLNPSCLVIVMTGKATVESSLEVLREGAWSYIPKPFSALHLNILIGRAAHLIMVGRTTLQVRKTHDSVDQPENIKLLGKSEIFKQVVQTARRVAATDASVFITGESGTGKEMIAQFIHEESRRASQPMVSINTAAMPETLLESEMFGHVAGAFSGAIRDKKGLLEATHGGTLFLDEINEMPLSVQTKLLRVIQDGVVRRVGSITVDAVVDVRFIAASNVDPTEAVKNGKLRLDLLYRLRVFPIQIPPLRERGGDIVLLAEHFLGYFWDRHRRGESRPAISADAQTALSRRPWRGNVRELRNVMEHTVVILPSGCQVVEADVLPFDEHGLEQAAEDQATGDYALNADYHSAREMVLSEFEKRYLKNIVRQANGNLSDAARLAGIDRTTLYRLMSKHDVLKGELLKVDGA